jgi:GT2 family glycosyltransferase
MNPKQQSELDEKTTLQERRIPEENSAVQAQIASLTSKIHKLDREAASASRLLMEAEVRFAGLQTRMLEKDRAIRELQEAKDRTIRELQQANDRTIRELQQANDRTIRELQQANESLTFYLSRYKRVKEKLLPTGSVRDRICRKVAGRLFPKAHTPSLPPASATETSSAALTPPSLPPASATETSSAALTPPTPASPSNTDEQRTIDLPAEWCDDLQRPPVVIAIPNWNRLEMLRNCIESVLANTGYDRYHICVYDQGSTDGSPEYLRSLGDRVDAIFDCKNIGFVGANNAIIRRYPKWDVVFLNNDTHVIQGWLERLAETAYKADNIGLVGAKLLYPDGRLQEAGSQIFQDGSARAYGKYEEHWYPEFNQIREVDYCSAACLYAKRRLLDIVGGFDERYAPAYYEDSDLAFAARAAGFKVLYQPLCEIVHHEFGTSGGTAFERMKGNREKFIAKWGDTLKHQQRSLWDVGSVSGREKVLVIHELLPSPDRSSGGARLHAFLRLLARRYHVVVAYLDVSSVREYLKPLESDGISVFYPGFAKAVHNQKLDLEAIFRDNEFSFVFCEVYDVAEQYMEMIRKLAPSSKLIVDTFDVHFLREMREAELRKDSELLCQAEATKYRELEVYRRADLVITVTQEDKNALLQADKNLNVGVISNIHALPEYVVGRQERSHLLFVGGFSHEPNVDAMLYFCKEVFPLVRASLPEIKLWVVGSAPPAEIIALGSDSVVVTGYVPYIAPYLQSALVSIAPLRYGSGMKGKIGEAMACGVPVVTTSVGAEGMDLRDQVDVMIADSAEEFADHIVRLNKEPELWEKLARNGQLRVQEEWSPEEVDRRLQHLLANMAGKMAHVTQCPQDDPRS